jgi:hypothetical protein
VETRRSLANAQEPDDLARKNKPKRAQNSCMKEKRPADKNPRAACHRACWPENAQFTRSFRFTVLARYSGPPTYLLARLSLRISPFT